MLGIFHEGNGGLAYLRQVKRADIAGHTYGNALVGRNQHIGESGRQEAGLLHGGIIVVHHIHRVKVNIPEQLIAEAVQLGLGVTGGSIGHVPGVDLTEVTLGIHKGVQKGLIALGQTDHGFVDCRVAVGVQPHGLTHDIRRLGSATVQKAHFIHGIKELPVGRLEAVNLRNGPGYNHRHGIGHIVDFQSFGNGLLCSGAMQTHDAVSIHFFLFRFLFFS